MPYPYHATVFTFILLNEPLKYKIFHIYIFGMFVCCLHFIWTCSFIDGRQIMKRKWIMFKLLTVLLQITENKQLSCKA